MKLLLLSDGRPGHANLSEGIVAALARNRSATIERMDVSRGRWPGPIAALSTRSILPDERILSMIYGIEPATLPAFETLKIFFISALPKTVSLMSGSSNPDKDFST